MGKGDKKTAKGKRVIGSYGNVRKRKDNKAIRASVPAEKEEKTAANKATDAKETAPKTAKKAAKSAKADE
jgi:30S ribosomal protein S31